MTNQTHCPDCGYNFAVFGRMHRCIPRLPAKPVVEAGATGSVLPATLKTGAIASEEAAAPAVDPAVSRRGAAGAYKYRDADKWRAYMRDYMRKRRGKEGISPAPAGIR